MFIGWFLKQLIEDWHLQISLDASLFQTDISQFFKLLQLLSVFIFVDDWHCLGLELQNSQVTQQLPRERVLTPLKLFDKNFVFEKVLKQNFVSNNGVEALGHIHPIVQEESNYLGETVRLFLVCLNDIVDVCDDLPLQHWPHFDRTLVVGLSLLFWALLVIETTTELVEVFQIWGPNYVECFSAPVVFFHLGNHFFEDLFLQVFFVLIRLGYRGQQPIYLVLIRDCTAGEEILIDLAFACFNSVALVRSQVVRKLAGEFFELLTRHTCRYHALRLLKIC